jgi:toxin YoeB
LPGGSAAPPRLEVYWTSQGQQDREYWLKRDRRVLSRIDRLIAEIQEHPFTGIGKAEPLRYEWAGYWSRRISKEHRLVYRVEAGTLFIAQCRFHYD